MVINAVALGTGALLFAAGGIALARIDEAHLERAERFLRIRSLGGILCALVLGWCMPQISAVAWDFLARWLLPLGAVAVVLVVRYLDNLVSRAIAGALILGSYTFLHYSFAVALPTGLVGAIAAWAWGIVGILLSAKPCWLRDYLRVAARNKGLRIAVAILMMLTCVILLAALYFSCRMGR